MEGVTNTANFDDLDTHQRLTLFTFAILSQHLEQKEALAEGLFEHLHDIFTTSPEIGHRPLIPLLTLESAENEEDWTLSGILNENGDLAPILPHGSECSPLVIGSQVLVPDPELDMNPYTILGAKPYGEILGDAPRRLLILGRISPERAAYFGTEPMLVFLDFDLSEEDAPQFHEIPLDLGECLRDMLKSLD